MDRSLSKKLLEALHKIDRPGSFCAHGSVPAILPGLEVKKLGPIGLPLSPAQAEELKARCEQAPHGKGAVTRVDTSVRRVWLALEPDRFTLTNPDWDKLVKDVVGKVQQELGLEKQKLQAHLYDLLLYEPGSFFVPHKDGEKLDRMVATLVVVLPSPHQGGELVIRHEGHEETIDFSTTSSSAFQVHFAAFYADCEHEIRPLTSGYRLCLVYNLTLAKGKKGLQAPRLSEHVEAIAALLAQGSKDPEAGKLAITLEHRYTEKGLAWDALKGVDRAVADAVDQAARRAGWHAYLTLLTLWESGSAEGEDYDYDYGRRGRWYEEEDDEDEEVEDEEDSSEGDYEMGEVFDSTLTAKKWMDRDGNGLPMEELSVEEDELLDPEALRNVKPEEEFEGYTGNAGMTLERWYRHAAIILWPQDRYFDILCAENPCGAIPLLKKLIAQWRKAGKKAAPAQQSQCQALATTMLARWSDNPHGHNYAKEDRSGELFGLLVELGDRKLIDTYLSDLMLRDVALDPGKALGTVGKEYGWKTLEPPLTAAFKNSTAAGLPRNVRVLEQLASARPRQDDGWSELCAKLAEQVVTSLQRTDLDQTTPHWQMPHLKREALLPGLIRALVAADQPVLLARLVAHTLAQPQKYPLLHVHLPALESLRDWLKKNVKAPNAGLSQWLEACRQQLEALTAAEPQKPTDFRRPATVSHKCKWCQELNRFLANPQEKVHRFQTHQVDRSHVENSIHQHHCDLDMTTERTRPSHTLVCTKNTNSFQAALQKYHEDRKHLAAVRSIEAELPG